MQSPEFASLPAHPEQQCRTKPLFVIEKFFGLGSAELCFWSADDLLAHIALLGPVECEDIAGGVPDVLDKDVTRVPVGGGKFALIDTEDYPLVRRYRWYLSGFGYAHTRSVLGGTSYLRMNRVVLMVGGKGVADHKDRDRLNNRKSNLRLCARIQNSWNSSVTSRNTSGFKGVSFVSGKWRGTVQADGVNYCKSFLTPEEADRWARDKREELHGEFACHG